MPKLPRPRLRLKPQHLLLRLNQRQSLPRFRAPHRAASSCRRLARGQSIRLPRSRQAQFSAIVPSLNDRGQGKQDQLDKAPQVRVALSSARVHRAWHRAHDGRCIRLAPFRVGPVARAAPVEFRAVLALRREHHALRLEHDPDSAPAPVERPA